MAHENRAGLPSPWAGFFEELDAALHEQVRVYCIGGFVVSIYYGLQRATGDVDYSSAAPIHCIKDLQALAGKDSALAKKYRVHLQHVAVNTLPENWEDRLVEMFAGQFTKLRLFAPDPYDLILSKLERNSSKDRDDVEYVARTCHLKPEALRDRYEKEMRPYIANETRHDLTLKLWRESCFPAAPARLRV